MQHGRTTDSTAAGEVFAGRARRSQRAAAPDFRPCPADEALRRYNGGAIDIAVSDLIEGATERLITTGCTRRGVARLLERLMGRAAVPLTVIKESLRVFDKQMAALRRRRSGRRLHGRDEMAVETE
jgi:hypothetical protein